MLKGVNEVLHTSVSKVVLRILLAIALPFAFATSQCYARGSQNPDNTSTNQPGKTPDANRADQQSQSPADRELTRKIRQVVVEDKSLSTYAHNVKIITRNGVVTLKGPVRSEEEKKAVEAKAAEIAGATNVKDEMTVKPKA
jgi:hyperosmotically inducible periplasmic protein